MLSTSYIVCGIKFHLPDHWPNKITQFLLKFKHLREERNLTLQDKVTQVKGEYENKRQAG